MVNTDIAVMDHDRAVYWWYWKNSVRIFYCFIVKRLSNYFFYWLQINIICIIPFHFIVSSDSCWYRNYFSGSWKRIMYSEPFNNLLNVWVASLNTWSSRVDMLIHGISWNIAKCFYFSTNSILGMHVIYSLT